MDRKMTRSILIGIGFIAYGLSALAVHANTIESIAPNDLEARITGSKGYFVVNITSTDPRCGYCTQANTKFVTLANLTPNVHFAQVSWAKWTNFPEELRGFLERNQIQGIPVRLAYQDGRLIDKVVGVPQDPAPASPLQVTGTIPVIDSHQVAEKIRGSKGLLVVQLTSFETSCSFCIRSNPVFEDLADAPENIKVKFVRVAYRPWGQMADDAFAQTFGYTGLPIFATYKDGRLVRQRGGSAEKSELQKILLTGLQ